MLSSIYYLDSYQVEYIEMDKYKLEYNGDNEYQKENEKLKKLIGDQALVIDELKKITEGGDNGSSE